MEHFENTQSTRRIYEGRVLNLRVDTVTLPSGRAAMREVVEHHGAICVVPVLDDGRIVMVRQFRKAVESDLLEIPAGGLNEHEAPLDCARRELMEECGLEAARLSPLFQCFLAPGYSTELMHGFLGEGLIQGTARPEEDENLEIEIYPLGELLTMIDDGRIRDSKSICGLLALYRLRQGP